MAEGLMSTNSSRSHLGLVGQDRDGMNAAYSPYWIIPDLTLQQVGQWGASRPAKAQPSDELRRTLLGVATAVAESVQRIETQAGAPWERTLPLDAAELSELTGITVRKTTTALVWLERAGIILAADRGHWCTTTSVWGSAPTLRVIAWDIVRKRLRDVRTPMAPALALLRTLALRVPPGSDLRTSGDGDSRVDPANGDTWCTLSSTDFIEATLFQRSAVLHGLAGLVRAGLVEQEVRRGQCGRWRLTPRAFGHLFEEAAPENSSPQTARDLRGRPLVAEAHERVVSAGQGIQVRIGGLTLSLPQGVTIRMSVDSSGRRTYHVGDNEMVIGPLE